MSLVDDLTAALATEFSGDVTFHPSMPSTILAPCVIVAPGDPFLTNATHGTVEESWDVLVAAGLKDPRRGVGQLRDLSLRVRSAAAGVGGLWQQAAAPRVNDQTLTGISVNRITFKYPPSDIGASS